MFERVQMRFLVNNDLNLLYDFFSYSRHIERYNFSHSLFYMWRLPCTHSISEYIRVNVPAGDLACLVIPVREASLFHRRHCAEWLGRCGGYVQQLLKSESSLNFVIYIPFLFLSSGHIKSRWSCEWPLIAGNVTAVRVKSGPKTHPDDSKTVTDISSSRLPTGRISPSLKFHQQALGATKVDLSNDPYFFLFWMWLSLFAHQNIFYHINNIQSDGKIVAMRLPVMASPTVHCHHRCQSKCKIWPVPCTSSEEMAVLWWKSGLLTDMNQGELMVRQHPQPTTTSFQDNNDSLWLDRWKTNLDCKN